MKKYRDRCAECGGRLGLGVRFRNLWNGAFWYHLRFCSSRCEEKNENCRRQGNRENSWLALAHK